MANSNRAPARARTRAPLPSPRRYCYTPELLAHGRHRFEHTEDSIPDIAVEFGIHKTTLLRLAKREGWVRYAPPPRDMSDATRLLAQAEKLEASTVAPTPDMSPPPAAPAGNAEQQAAPPAPEQTGVVAADLEAMLNAVRGELAVVREMRAQLRHRPQSPLDAERTARTLSSLTQTLYKLQRMSCGISEADIYDDDITADIDAFRDQLARRIDAFVESRLLAEAAERSAASGDGPVSS